MFVRKRRHVTFYMRSAYSPGISVSTWLLRLLAGLLIGVVLGYVGGGVAHADEMTPDMTDGFWTLQQAAPETVGLPIEAERGGDMPGSTIVRTTTGLMYWQPGLRPSWTDGHNRLTTQGPATVAWTGVDLSPPVVLSPAGTNPGDWPIGGALGQRIYCVEAIESAHGRLMYNPTPWHGEHAQGWLGYLPSTAQRWGVAIGNRASEWDGAARMIAAGAGGQFAYIAWGRC